MATLGDRLRTARDRRNYKQVQVAKILGISNKTVSGYENNVSEPDIETLKVLANLYEVSLDWLSGNESEIDSEPADTPGEPADLKEILKESAVFYEGIELSDEDKKKIDDYVRFMFWDLEKQKRKKD